jgi:hypothetical protein
LIGGPADVSQTKNPAALGKPADTLGLPDHLTRRRRCAPCAGNDAMENCSRDTLKRPSFSYDHDAISKK